MTVHVGELTSEVQVHGGPAGGTAPGGAAGAEQPTWEERGRIDRLIDERCRERERTTAERFDV